MTLAVASLVPARSPAAASMWAVSQAPEPRRGGGRRLRRPGARGVGGALGDRPPDCALQSICPG